MQNYVNLLPVKLVFKYRAPLHEKAVIYFYSTEMLRSAVDVTGQCINIVCPACRKSKLITSIPTCHFSATKLTKDLGLGLRKRNFSMAVCQGWDSLGNVVY